MPVRAPRPRARGEYYSVAHLSTGDIFRAQAVAGHRVRSRGEALHGRRRARARRDRRRRDRGGLAPGVRSATASCSTASRARCTRPRSSTVCSTAGRSTWRSTSTCPGLVLDRLAGRRVCESCQRVYHVNMPPEVDWTCDTCGGNVVQRDDDTEEAIDRRLAALREQTVPIIEYYRQRGLLVVVSGVGDGDDVFKRLTPRWTPDAARNGSLRKTPYQIHVMRQRGGSSPRCTRCARGWRSRVRRPPTSTPPRVKCSIAGAPVRTSSTITASRPWRAPRRTR